MDEDEPVDVDPSKEEQDEDHVARVRVPTRVDVYGRLSTPALTPGMTAGVQQAIEDLVVAGDATAASPRDNFDGILNTTGAGATAFAADLLTTARKGLTSLQQLHLKPPFVDVMNAATWEQFELLTGANQFLLSDPGTGGRSLPVDASRQSLWGNAVALAESVPAGQAILGSWNSDSIRLRPREAVQRTRGLLAGYGVAKR
jgi:capsid protein